MSPRPATLTLRFFAGALGLFTAYLVTARLGLRLGAVSGFATLVWAPTGIALFALLRFGYRYWPAVFCAALVANLMNGAPVLVAAGIGVGNTLEPLVGTFLLKLVGFDSRLSRLRDVGAIVLLAAGLSAVISASLGLASLLLGGVVVAADAPGVWKAWWLGDALGALTVAPLLFVWTRRPLPQPRLASMLEAVLLLGALAVLGSLVFGVAHDAPSPILWPYIIYPGIFWAALRFTQLGAVTATVIISAIAITHTALGHGPFALPSLSQSLTLVQVFMAVSAVTGLVLAAAVSERDLNAERLTASERKLAAIFHNAPFAISLTRMPEGTLADVNPAFTRLFGYTREELIGKTSVELGMHVDLRARERVREQFDRHGLVRNMENQVLDRAGRRLTVSNNIDLIVVDGQQYALGTLEDVTQRRAAEQALLDSERHFRFLADNLPQIIWTATPDGTIDYSNARWREFAGTEGSTASDREWTSRVHPNDFESVRATWRRCLDTGEPFQMELRLFDPAAGSYRWFLARAVPLKNDQGRPARWFGTATDIGDQKKQTETLAEALHSRDDFLAMAGHELRTPLAVLLMHVHGLQRAERSGSPPAKLKERLEKASGAGLRLDNLINQMLDVSRIAAGRLLLDVEPFELLALVREVIDRFAEEGERVGSQLSLTANASAAGAWDRLRVEQMVSNLLSNAIKYGEGKPIEVQLDEESGEAVLRVTDHGIGIDASQQSKIFERFERAVGVREFGGFGLGLWIARQIAETSGGSIGVSSSPGHGSTFTLRLPLHRLERSRVQ
jgi:PAS domain S-box-containing protein